MEGCPAGVEGLQFVLDAQGCEQVIGVFDRQLGGIGVVRLGPLGHIFFIGYYDLRIAFLVLAGDTIGYTLRRSRFQVEYVAGLFLITAQAVAHIIHHFYGKLMPRITGYILAQEIQTAFVHSYQADGREMVFPVLIGALLDPPQVELGVGI